MTPFGPQEGQDGARWGQPVMDFLLDCRALRTGLRVFGYKFTQLFPGTWTVPVHVPCGRTCIPCKCSAASVREVCTGTVAYGGLKVQYQRYLIPDNIS